jgi:hypothetical protein
MKGHDPTTVKCEAFSGADVENAGRTFFSIGMTGDNGLAGDAPLGARP